MVTTDEHALTSLLKVTSHSPVATGVAVTAPALLLELTIVQVELTCAQLFLPCSVAINRSCASTLSSKAGSPTSHRRAPASSALTMLGPSRRAERGGQQNSPEYLYPLLHSDPPLFEWSVHPTVEKGY